MSIKVMTYVWEHSQHKGSELLTLLAIADFSHDDGTNAYPSIASLATKTRMTERNVQMVLRKLQASEELSLERNAGPKGCHLFRVNMSPSHGPKKRGGENFSPPKTFHPEKFAPGGVKAASPKPSVDPSEDLSPSLRSGERARARRISLKRCPPDYEPSPGVRLWAQEKHPDIDFEEALEAMRDCEFTKPHSDWDATLRNWIRKEPQFGPRVVSRRNGHLPDKIAYTAQSALYNLKRRQANGQHGPELRSLPGSVGQDSGSLL
jgi:hypothetical protein